MYIAPTTKQMQMLRPEKNYFIRLWFFNDTASSPDYTGSAARSAKLHMGSHIGIIDNGRPKVQRYRVAERPSNTSDVIIK
jgi:hypothetical protein